MVVVHKEKDQQDNCNARHFSRLMKSCFPNPNETTTPSRTHPLTTLPKTTSSSLNPTTTATSAAPSKKCFLLSLPDDILLEIISRVPLPSLPPLASTSHRIIVLLTRHSTPLSLLRKNHRLLHRTVFAFSLSTPLSLLSLRLSHDPAWTPLSLLPPNTDLDHSTLSPRLVPVGRKVFLVGKGTMFCYDPWTGRVEGKAGMINPRKRFAAAEVAGKIYVAGGSPAAVVTVEEYCPRVDEWRVVAHAPRGRYGCLGVGVDGVFYVIGGLKIGGSCGGGGGGGTSLSRAVVGRGYSCSMDLYDVRARGWLRSRTVPGGGCIVAACGVMGFVYVLTSHAVELSFWRFNATRKGGGGNGGGWNGSGFGEWCRMRGPPLPAQVRLDGTVRFTCVGVGEKVVLIQVMGCIDDLLRRSGRNGRGYREGLVLVFDCVTEEWSRGPDLTQLAQSRVACVCVEC